MISTSTKATLTLCVFAIGAGLGFGLKQGWVPIELVAPPAGVVHEDEPTSKDIELTAARSVDLAGQSEPAAPLFEQQEEPSTSAAVVPEDRPRRLEIPVDDESPAVTTSNPPRSRVQQAKYDEPAPVATPSAAPPQQKSLAETLAIVQTHLEHEEWLAAHKELSRLYWAEPERRDEIMDRINYTAQAIFFSPQPHFIQAHTVSAGDRLQTIASQYKLTWEYLAQLNQIDPKRIRDGQKLKVIRGPFSAVVELADYSLTVHLQGYYVKRYDVGIGKDGASPIGKHTVLDKVVNPQYTAPDGKVMSGDDPANPLGERWINLGGSYGIHGTIEPDSIGKAASRGCIRLGNDDVIEVYNFLTNGSEVVIRR